MKLFSSFLLKLLGWNITNDISPEIRKAVIIVVPHTRFWDTPLGKIGFWHLGVDSKILIKKEAFSWPFGIFLRKLGGIPVNRNKSTKLTEAVAQMYNANDSLFITIAPEGTRAKVSEWKRGFYYIALAAKVPIILGTLNYNRKDGGMKKLFYPSGNYDRDIIEIQSFYKEIEKINS